MWMDDAHSRIKGRSGERGPGGPILSPATVNAPTSDMMRKMAMPGNRILPNTRCWRIACITRRPGCAAHVTASPEWGLRRASRCIVGCIQE